VSLITYLARFLVTLMLLRRVGVRHTVPGPDDVVWLWRRAMREVVRLR
jgi:hypothetical protein